MYAFGIITQKAFSAICGRFSGALGLSGKEMTDITDYIQSYEECLKRYDPDFLELFKSGGARDLVESKLNSLPLSLPSDLIELYVWRDGLKGWKYFESFIDGYTFLPLDEAIKSYDLNVELQKRFDPKGIIFGGGPWPGEKIYPKGIFTFMQCDGNYVGIAEAESNEESSELVSVSRDGDIRVYFSSLSKLFEYLAKCHEEGILPDEDGEAWEKLEEFKKSIDPKPYA